MGCGDSAPQVATKAKVWPHNPPVPPAIETKTAHYLVNPLREAVDEVIKGISRLPKPNVIHAISVISESVVPIILGPLFMASSAETELELPIAALGLYEKGRIAALGHIDMISIYSLDNTEASVFLENLIRWTGGNTWAVLRILFLGLDDETEEALEVNLEGCDVIIEKSTEWPETKRYHIVITTTAAQFPDKIEEFVKEGGGAIIGDISDFANANPAMYFMLLKMGIGYPQCSMTIGDASINTVKVVHSFSTLCSHRFTEMVRKYLKIAENPKEINVSEYDGFVTLLRYNVMVLGTDPDDRVIALFRAAQSVLEQTGYVTESGKYCTSLIHLVTIVLVGELLPRIPAHYFVGTDISEVFPGSCGNCEVGIYQTHHTLTVNSWASTGLYLPPGIAAKVKQKNGHNTHVLIQVGSHLDILLNKSTPWARSAFVTQQFEFLQPEIDISWPHGGIIYVVIDDIDTIGAVEIELEFENVTTYPFYIHCDPSVYDLVMDSQVPWGEIETEWAIFTLPSDVMRKTNIPEFTKVIDALFTPIVHLFADDSDRLARFVFDVECPEVAVRYPTVLPMEMLQIFTDFSPTSDMFTLCRLFADQCLPHIGFGPDQDTGFECLAATLAFRIVWPMCNPITFFNESPPRMFKKLWKIYRSYDKGQGIFHKVFESIREVILYETESPSFLWAMWIKKLSKFTKTNFEKVLYARPKVCETGVITTSSPSLSKFRFEDLFSCDSANQ